jgi:hypothetical protein
MEAVGAESGNRSSIVELIAEEAAGWEEMRSLMASLSPDQAEESGYYPEGWSAKDLLAHVGTWLAEAGVILERISVGTYRADEIDVDAMNEQFYEAMKDVPLQTVSVQAASARTRMLRGWGALREPSEDAAFWVAKSGAEHYAEHLPRLREWVAQLRP